MLDKEMVDTAIISLLVISIILFFTILVRDIFFHRIYRQTRKKLFDIDDRIDDQNIKISVLEEFKRHTENKLDKSLLDSPTQISLKDTLTDKGKALLLDSGSYDYIQKNKQKFLDEIKSKNPKSPTDIHDYSIEVINSKTNLEDFKPVKSYAWKEGIELDSILQISSIYLREISLEILKV